MTLALVAVMCLVTVLGLVVRPSASIVLVVPATTTSSPKVPTTIGFLPLGLLPVKLSLRFAELLSADHHGAPRGVPGGYGFIKVVF